MYKRAWLFPALVIGCVSAAHGGATRLLLTEIVVSPTEAEFIAIYNPNAERVELTYYYLADYESYYKVVTATPPTSSSDFVVRFPAGSVIEPGETQYVAVGGAECLNSGCGSGTFSGFGVYPTYEIASSTSANNSAAVSDMVVPFTGAVGTAHGLTNAGELVMLFYWDGVSNLVTDVDYVYYGTASLANPAVNKTGIMINGSNYLPDTVDSSSLHAPLSPAVSGNTSQTCRKVPISEAGQTATGGNGVGGADETSEPSANTWTACEPASISATSSDNIFVDGFEN